MGQMYGEFDPSSHEWQDGIMSTMYRYYFSALHGQVLAHYEQDFRKYEETLRLRTYVVE